MNPITTRYIYIYIYIYIYKLQADQSNARSSNSSNLLLSLTNPIQIKYEGRVRNESIAIQEDKKK